MTFMSLQSYLFRRELKSKLHSTMIPKLSLYILLVLVYATGVAVASEGNSLAIAMICRNEEVNFRSNLALWLPVAKYFVFMLDRRTTDKSESAVTEILSGRAQYKVIPYEFTGFGPARTASLQAVWRYYPQASHVLIADPDWKPEVSTLDLTQLDTEHDVFRFLVYDRNGQTTRRMDWLLRNREGLKMRYHLHEVLDIGHYKFKHISWVAHEIEKPGTWHTAVGHGNSMSAQRFTFDLEMLYKDFDMYGHDPHVHYYLGLTHQAFVEATISSRIELKQNVTQDHIDRSVRFLKLRVFSEYEDDFVEQRWSAMMLLGQIYTNYKHDFTNAELWLSLCRDYNPLQTECGLALTKIYYLHGSFGLAMTEMEKIIKGGTAERAMLNFYNQWNCDVPLMAFKLFTEYIRIYGKPASSSSSDGVLAGDVIYLLLLRSMLQNEKCRFAPEQYQMPDEVLGTVRRLLGTLSVSNRGALSISSSQMDLCSSPHTVRYLLSRGYKLHPCEGVTGQATSIAVCGDFVSFLPAPSEEYQARERKEFIGSASLPDIVHHVYAGDSKKLRPLGRPFRVLFAEYFNPRSVYSLVGKLAADGRTNFEIVVVIPPSVVVANVGGPAGSDEFVPLPKRIKDVLAACRDSSRPAIPVEIVEKTASDYFSALMSAKLSAANKGLYDPRKFQFDFIEYNEGMSMNPLYREHLNMMSQFLTDDGSVGITYYTKNIHQETIAKLVAQKNDDYMIPFSLQPRRIAERYLRSDNSLQFLAEDEQLVGFLSGDIDGHLHRKAMLGKKVRDADTKKGLSGRVFTKDDAMAALIAAGLEPLSFVPTAFSHPFSELDNYEIQKYRSLGISEEDFLHNTFPSFRHTVYAYKKSSADPPPGRARVGLWLLPLGEGEDLPSLFARQALGPPYMSGTVGDIVVLDRLGQKTLGTTFVSSQMSAQRSLSTTYSYAHYSAGNLNITSIALPAVGACMSLLSDQPTIAQLEQANKDAAAARGEAYNEAYSRHLLLQMLKFFESINAISFWYVEKEGAGTGAGAGAGAGAGTRGASQAILNGLRTSKNNLDNEKAIPSPQTTASQGWDKKGAGASGYGGLSRGFETNQGGKVREDSRVEVGTDGRIYEKIGGLTVSKKKEKSKSSSDSSYSDSSSSNDADRGGSVAGDRSGRSAAAQTSAEVGVSGQAAIDAQERAQKIINEKKERMVKMGFPEDIIETTIKSLEEELKRTPFKLA